MYLGLPSDLGSVLRRKDATFALDCHGKKDCRSSHTNFRSCLMECHSASTLPGLFMVLFNEVVFSLSFLLSQSW
jgi:hypothetical protein